MEAAAGGSTRPTYDGDDDDDDDFGRVYFAVAAGASAEEVRSVIEHCARGSDERRAEAVETAGEHDGELETPLQAARRMERGDLVGALLEAGANVDGEFANSPLALCIAFGQVDSLRALLKSGRFDARAPVPYGPPDARFECSLVHFCVATGPGAPPQVGCLDLLVREFGAAAINARDSAGVTPLAWLVGWAPPMFAGPAKTESAAAFELLVGAGADVNARDPQGIPPIYRLLCRGGDQRAAIDLFVRHGADVEARDDRGETPIFACARLPPHLATVQRLLEHGASVDVVNADGWTPLFCACDAAVDHYTPLRRAAIELLLRRSSVETRRAVVSDQGLGCNALDLIFYKFDFLPHDPWFKQIIAEYLTSAAPLVPDNVRAALRIAAALLARRERQLAARRTEARRWRAHDALVGLALDAHEARDVQEAVDAAERRVQELEEELEALSLSLSSSSSEEEEEEEEEEAGGVGGGEGEGKAGPSAGA